MESFESFEDREAGLRIDRATRGGSLQLTLTGPAAVGLLNLLRRVNSTYLPVSPIGDALGEGLTKLLRSEEAGQRLDPAFASSEWNRSTDPRLRALRTGIPSEPGVALGSHSPEFGRNLCIGTGDHEKGIHLKGCPDGE